MKPMPKQNEKLQRMIREKFGSQFKFAAKSGINPAILSQICQGWLIPKDHQIKKIEKHLGCNVNEIF